MGAHPGLFTLSTIGWGATVYLLGLAGERLILSVWGKNSLTEERKRLLRLGQVVVFVGGGAWLLSRWHRAELASRETLEDLQKSLATQGTEMTGLEARNDKLQQTIAKQGAAIKRLEARDDTLQEALMVATRKSDLSFVIVHNNSDSPLTVVAHKKWITRTETFEHTLVPGAYKIVTVQQGHSPSNVRLAVSGKMLDVGHGSIFTVA